MSEWCFADFVLPLGHGKEMWLIGFKGYVQASVAKLLTLSFVALAVVQIVENILATGLKKRAVQ